MVEEKDKERLKEIVSSASWTRCGPNSDSCERKFTATLYTELTRLVPRRVLFKGKDASGMVRGRATEVDVIEWGGEVKEREKKTTTKPPEESTRGLY